MSDYLPHQKILADLVTKAKAKGDQINSGAETKQPYSADLIADTKPFPKDQGAKFAEQFGKKYPTDPTFLELTGTPHAHMLHNWVHDDGIMTACNGLVGSLCGKMGAKLYLGQFELEKFLKKNGVGHTFVDAESATKSGRRPNYGDPWRAKTLHMGITLDFDGDTWTTIEAGQGGRSSGFDIIRLKTRAFEPDHLIGWCDMRLLLDPRPVVPDWLLGVWSIRCGDDNYTYRFTRYHEVLYYASPALGKMDAKPFEVGEFKFSGTTDKFTINWKTSGEETFWYERFESVPGLMEKMSGETLQKLRPPGTNKGWGKPESEKMTAVKM